MRIRNWDVRLVRALGPLKGEPLVWGETDCVSLCLRALEAMYPPDDLPAPRKSERPEWTTKTGALRVLHREPAFHEVLREHGCTEVMLSFAQQGDVVCGLPQGDELPGYGVCAEGGVYHVDVEDEVVRWDRLRHLRAAGLDVQVLRPPHE